MIDLNINVNIPFLWGTEGFSKNEWGSVNILVGSNGTGKSIFSEHLKTQLISNGLKVRSLIAERLFGLEKLDYGYFGSRRNGAQGINISEFNELKSDGDKFGLSKDAFVILKERLDIRVKIEALLAEVFKKNIRLVEQGGYLKAKIQNLSGGEEYTLDENESHGLKELITLFVFLYDDRYNCIIFDEPELHLHPQFQSFFLNEIRKLAGNPKIDATKKMFFIITHSPYFIDLRTLEDFKSVLVFHHKKIPTYIDRFESDDEWRIRRFLPRLNTHHKQFFFSPNPVFVEGYSDQQIFTLLFEKLSKNISASGSCIIDVGGKDEMEVFYRLCKKLKINAKFIADLDTVFKGKLKQTVSNDERAGKFIQDTGIGSSVITEIGDLESKLGQIGDELVTKTCLEEELLDLVTHLKHLSTDEIHKKRCFVLQAILRFGEKILREVDDSNKILINFIIGRYKKILEAFEKCNVYILENGPIETYYRQSNVNYLSINNKDKLFEKERDYLLSCDSVSGIESDYKDLLDILNKSVPYQELIMDEHIKFTVLEWIQAIQWSIAKGEINSLEQLKTSPRAQYPLYSQILDVNELILEKNKNFKCKISLNSSISKIRQQIEFTDRTIAQDFSLMV